jgi:hypothetical protein
MLLSVNLPSFRKEHKKMKRKKKNKRSIRVNQVKITFTRKPITAWGGIATLTGKFLESIGFQQWVEKNIPINETSNNAKGVYEKVLGQFLTVLAGGSRFQHLSWWGHGKEVMLKAFNVDWLPQATSVMTRFWGKIDSQANGEQMGQRCREFARKLIGWDRIKEDNLNLDSSVLTRYGNQQGAVKGYNPKKKGRPSHHPLLAFLGCGYVVNLWNRSGDSASGQNAVGFLKQTIAALGKGFSIRKVLCDAGFYRLEFIEHLEANEYSYIIAASLAPILQQQIYCIKRWQTIESGIEVGEFEFRHLDEKWTKARRYVAVRQQINRRPQAAGKQPKLFRDMEDWQDYRFSLMITNDRHLSPEEVWRAYRPRANDENVIKDLKEGYGFASFNMHNFWATEAVMVANALLYHNLVHYLNRNIFNTNSPKEQLKTLRSKYFILPAMLGSEDGYPVLRLGVRDRKFRTKLIYYLEKIMRIPHSLNCNAVET